MSEKKIIYRKDYILKRIEWVTEEAEKGVSDSERIISTSDIPKILRGASGVRPNHLDNALALYTGFLSVILSASIGSFFCASAFHLLAFYFGDRVKEIPVILIVGIFVFLVIIINKLAGRIANKSLTKRKEELLHTTIKMHNDIIHQSKLEIGADEKRAEYLSSLNTVLQEIINDLKSDLAAVA